MKQESARRDISVDDVLSALITIRDNILTDENITTTKSVIDKMSELMFSIYSWINRDSVTLSDIEKDISDTDVEAETRALFNPEALTVLDSVKDLFYNKDNEPIVTIGGLIDAIRFIKTHLSKSDDILNDIIKIMTSLQTVQLFDKKHNDSRGVLEIDRENLRSLYNELVA